MKALTVRQPYAHFIACDQKRVENRPWATSYRGDIVIHAGKSRTWHNVRTVATRTVLEKAFINRPPAIPSKITSPTAGPPAKKESATVRIAERWPLRQTCAQMARMSQRQTPKNGTHRP